VNTVIRSDLESEKSSALPSIVTTIQAGPNASANSYTNCIVHQELAVLIVQEYFLVKIEIVTRHVLYPS
jgi:hypothetical protein